MCFDFFFEGGAGCGDACEKHAHDEVMKKCADECRKCEKACHEMLKHVGHHHDGKEPPK